MNRRPRSCCLSGMNRLAMTRPRRVDRRLAAKGGPGTRAAPIATVRSIAQLLARRERTARDGQARTLPRCRLQGLGNEGARRSLGGTGGLQSRRTSFHVAVSTTSFRRLIASFSHRFSLSHRGETSALAISDTFVVDGAVSVRVCLRVAAPVNVACSFRSASQLTPPAGRCPALRSRWPVPRSRGKRGLLNGNGEPNRAKALSIPSPIAARDLRPPSPGGEEYRRSTFGLPRRMLRSSPGPRAPGRTARPRRSTTPVHPDVRAEQTTAGPASGEVVGGAPAGSSSAAMSSNQQG